MLGLIVSEITNPFFPELVQEFENLAVAQGYEVLIGSTNYEPARTESLIRRMMQRRSHAARKWSATISPRYGT